MITGEYIGTFRPLVVSKGKTASEIKWGFAREPWMKTDLYPRLALSNPNAQGWIDKVLSDKLNGSGEPQFDVEDISRLCKLLLAGNDLLDNSKAEHLLIASTLFTAFLF